MSTETSPRPWRVEDDQIVDANGLAVTPIDGGASVSDANAALIVDAVNERDRLRDLVRRFLDLFTPGTIHPAGTMERLLREARAAIGGEKQ